jgi:hypothetical protein
MWFISTANLIGQSNDEYSKYGGCHEVELLVVKGKVF